MKRANITTAKKIICDLNGVERQFTTNKMSDEEILVAVGNEGATVKEIKTIFYLESDYNEYHRGAKGIGKTKQQTIHDTMKEAQDRHTKLYEIYCSRINSLQKQRVRNKEERREKKEFILRTERVLNSGNGQLVDLDYYVQIKGIKIPLSKVRTLQAFSSGKLNDGKLTTMRGTCQFKTAQTLIDYIATKIMEQQNDTN